MNGVAGQRRGTWLVGAAATTALIAIGFYHYEKLGLEASWQIPIILGGFLTLLVQVAMANLNSSSKLPADLTLRVAVVVPVYNEDPETFRRCLESLSMQSRLPDAVYVVDDGSDSTECRDVFNGWNCAGITHVEWISQANAGKREAQAQAFARDDTVSVWVTIDSDTVLDQYAIENGLRPLGDPEVMGVSSLLLGLNYKTNLLTRLTDLGFVGSFLSGRAAWSRVGSVAVSCGGLALYRGWVIRKHLEHYLTQTVGGRKVSSGDDRMLTNYALLEGKTVFERSSVGYTLLPENLRHLTKQRIRWWRSFFWGGEWLTRRFSPKRLVWWMVSWQLISFALFTVLVPYVLVVSPIARQVVPAAFVAYICLLGYVRNASYLSFRRPDQSMASQFGIYLLSPLSVLLHFYLCTVLQYAGLWTVRQTGWSTRKNVEVKMEAAA